MFDAYWNVQMHRVLVPFFLALCITPSTHSLEGTLMVCLCQSPYHILVISISQMKYLVTGNGMIGMAFHKLTNLYDALIQGRIEIFTFLRIKMAKKLHVCLIEHACLQIIPERILNLFHPLVFPSKHLLLSSSFRKESYFMGMGGWFNESLSPWWENGGLKLYMNFVLPSGSLC